MDEAGTSASEPVTVVVGIIVKPDEKWNAVLQETVRLKKTVPERYRDGFIFHAKTIWGDPSLREGWPIKDRLKLIAEYASIPVRFGLSIAVGKIRRDAGGEEMLSRTGLGESHSLAQWHHVQAFMECVLKADGYLRERCEVGEIATLIAEDIPEMRQRLRGGFEIARRLYIPDKFLGIQGRRQQGISQIQDGVQFVDKLQAPLLQVADACAFSLRRFFSNQKYGDALIRAMGVTLEREQWSGPMSSSIFTNDPVLRYSPYSSHDTW